MQPKKFGMMMVALAAALATVPAMAAPHGGGGGRGGGGQAAATGARASGGASMGRAGGASMGQTRVAPSINTTRSMAGPGVRATTTGSSRFAATTGNWNGSRWHDGRRRHHGFARGFGLGFATGAFIGGSSYYYGDPYYDDYAYDDGYYDDSYAAAPGYSSADAQACAQRYRSYDPSTGTYLGYDGIRHPCP